MSPCNQWHCVLGTQVSCKQTGLERSRQHWMCSWDTQMLRKLSKPIFLEQLSFLSWFFRSPWTRRDTKFTAYKVFLVANVLWTKYNIYNLPLPTNHRSTSQPKPQNDISKCISCHLIVTWFSRRSVKFPVLMLCVIKNPCSWNMITWWKYWYWWKIRLQSFYYISLDLFRCPTHHFAS